MGYDLAGQKSLRSILHFLFDKLVIQFKLEHRFATQIFLLFIKKYPRIKKRV